MIDALTTEAMWDVLHGFAHRQKQGERITAEEVHAELTEFLHDQDIEFPATFDGNSVYEIFRVFVDGGALFVDNSYPEMGPQRFVHPIFIECGEAIDSKILAAYPQLGEYFTRAFCPDSVRAADAAEVETESAPAAPFTQADADAEIYQHVDLATVDDSATASGWILQERAKEGNIIAIDDERDWRVTRVYDGFLLNGAQIKLLPPHGYISDTVH